MNVVCFLIVLFFWYRTEVGLNRDLKREGLSSLFITLTPFLFLLLNENSSMLVLCKGVFVCLIYYIGCFDYYTQTIPRFTHYIIVILSLAIANNFFEHLAGALIFVSPLALLYLIQRLKKTEANEIGFGDVLYILSGTFFLGPIPGFVGMMTGLMLFVICGLIFEKGNQPRPLAPSLSIGFLTGLFLMI